jgi:DNA-binding Lrp family transcriptional regulator
MREKIRKLLYYYCKNSRITTKELGQKTSCTQQSVSYLLNQLKKKEIILQNTTIIDSVKLGFINILVGFNILKIEDQLRNGIILELKKIKNIVYIEEGKEGVDLIVEFCSKNLASFNKIYLNILQKFEKSLKTVFIFPLVTRKEYFKKYLLKNPELNSITLSGDRIMINLNKRETKIVNLLIKNPTIKIIGISENTKISVKSSIKIKKKLQENRIIRGYSAVLNNKKLGMVRQIIFLRFLSEGLKEMDRFENYCRNNKNIIEFNRLIGASHCELIVESLQDLDIIKDIRSNFPIDSYMMVKSEKIHKKDYVPEEFEKE